MNGGDEKIGFISSHYLRCQYQDEYGCIIKKCFLITYTYTLDYLCESITVNNYFLAGGTQSHRKAINGSIFVTRCAGFQQASNATNVSSNEITMKVKCLSDAHRIAGSSSIWSAPMPPPQSDQEPCHDRAKVGAKPH